MPKCSLSDMIDQAYRVEFVCIHGPQGPFALAGSHVLPFFNQSYHRIQLFYKAITYLRIYGSAY